MQPLTVPGTRESLEAVARFVQEASGEAGLARKAGYRLRQAVDELATNAIVHGYERSGQEGRLYLSAEIGDGQLSIVVEDTGPPFDPTAIARPESLDRPPEERQVGGLGIFLALRNVDDFAYARVAGRNRSTLTIKLPPAAA